MARGMARVAALATMVLAGIAAACAHNVPAPALRPALAGSWVLVADSGHARPSLAAASTNESLPEPVSEGGGMRGGRRGGGERGERGDGGYNRARTYDPGAVQEALAALTRGEPRLNIALSDTAVHLDFADASYFDLTTNGHSGDDVWRNVGRIKSSARWSEAGLVFRRKLDNGVSVEQTYSRPSGSNRLIVVSVIKGPVPRPITERRVYEPAPSAAR